MSFVTNLRMRNMFPVRSNLGDAEIRTGGSDPMYEVLHAANMQNNRVSVPTAGGMGIRNMGNPNVGQEPLRFGGVVGEQSNPGADILNRAGQNAERIWEGYKERLNPDVSGPSNDALDYQRYLDNALKSKTVDSNITQNERRLSNEDRRLANENRRLDETARRTTNAEDANNRRISLLEDAAKDKKDLATDKQNETIKKQEESENLIKQHANDALGVLNEISKATGKFDEEGNSIEELSPNVQNITGFSGNVPTMISDLNPSNASARASINRLKDMLTLDRMQSLRKESKTGSTGFGSNMNQKEFSTLVNSASKLATMNQSEPGYAKELGRVRTLLTKAAGSSNTIEREIPGSNGKMAISTDGGKTWKAK